MAASGNDLAVHLFWGKLERGEEGVREHPLVDHCIDVALTFRTLVGLPAMRRRLEGAAGHKLSDIHLDRLAVVAFLHDLGKCNRGFQAKRDPDAVETAGHVVEAVALLAELRPLWPESLDTLLQQICSWFRGGPEQAEAMLLAAISHHGRPVSRMDVDASADRQLARWWRARGAVDPQQGLDELAQCVREVFPAAFEANVSAVDATASLQQRFAGLVMLADWVGSDTAFFPYRADDQEDRHALAASAARRAISGIGIARPDPEPEVLTDFVEVFGFPPSPLQQMLAAVLPVDEASRLVLVESETGSGKTEAALAWFHRLYTAGEVDGLYFALPTRVAARELYARVCRSHASAFVDPTTRPGPVLLAAPGYARVDDVGAAALPNPEGLLWEDDAALRRHERQWASAHPKRFLAAPVAVGTIDQALLSVLKVKHALLRSVCLDRSLIVVDEVHASDPYMRQTLQALLDGHLKRGGRALLLSATLGESAAAAFFGCPIRGLKQSLQRPYPSVTTCAGERPVGGTRDVKCVRVELLPGLDTQQVLPIVIAAVADGARVLVVCNTVSRANELLRAVEKSGRIPACSLFTVNGAACPHHGRFAREHREVMDAAVTRALGKGSPDGGLLLVGTQTLEQSLDIDADLLVTDLCPMDVLLQRVGRLHRHARVRRPCGYAHPRVLIRAPEHGDLRAWLQRDGTLRAPAGLGTVYPDGRVLQRTLDTLKGGPTFEIPLDNRRLIEQTTHPEALAILPVEWQSHAQHLEGQLMADVRASLTSTIEELPFGDLHYPSSDERVSTRLGAPNLDIKLAQPMSHPFGIVMRSVGIPAHMGPRDAGVPDVVETEPFEEGFKFQIGTRSYQYTRYGLEKSDA
jgi:CRISPR-associated endonuclease/helicase Cas3